MIISRFKDVNLFRSMLADCSVSRRQELGHMAAVGTILDQIEISDTTCLALNGHNSINNNDIF